MVKLLTAAGLEVADPSEFVDAGYREVLDKRHPDSAFAFGMLVLIQPLQVS